MEKYYWLIGKKEVDRNYPKKAQRLNLVGKDFNLLP